MFQPLSERRRCRQIVSSALNQPHLFLIVMIAEWWGDRIQPIELVATELECVSSDILLDP